MREKGGRLSALGQGSQGGGTEGGFLSKRNRFIVTKWWRREHLTYVLKWPHLWSNTYPLSAAPSLAAIENNWFGDLNIFAKTRFKKIHDVNGFKIWPYFKKKINSIQLIYVIKSFTVTFSSVRCKDPKFHNILWDEFSHIYTFPLFFFAVYKEEKSLQILLKICKYFMRNIHLIH